MAAPPIRIAPSLLSADFARLGDDVAAVEEAGADWLHVDVMDGHFVPNLTIGPPVVKAIHRVARVPLDVHIMIEEPARWAKRYVEAGAHVVTFHVEAAAPDSCARAVEEIRAAGARPAASVKPDTPIERVRDLLAELEMVLVMSVEPGFGGQRFRPEVLPKIERLRDWGFERDVEIDGGIDVETIGDAAAAGANVFVSGTGIFRTDDWSATIRDLRRRAEERFPLRGRSTT